MKDKIKTTNFSETGINIKFEFQFIFCFPIQDPQPQLAQRHPPPDKMHRVETVRRQVDRQQRRLQPPIRRPMLHQTALVKQPLR